VFADSIASGSVPGIRVAVELRWRLRRYRCYPNRGSGPGSAAAAVPCGDPAFHLAENLVDERDGFPCGDHVPASATAVLGMPGWRARGGSPWRGPLAVGRAASLSAAAATSRGLTPLDCRPMAAAPSWGLNLGSPVVVRPRGGVRLGICILRCGRGWLAGWS
jgi:hypothetical protein